MKITITLALISLSALVSGASLVPKDGREITDRVAETASRGEVAQRELCPLSPHSTHYIDRLPFGVLSRATLHLLYFVKDAYFYDPFSALMADAAHSTLLFVSMSPFLLFI